MERPFEAYRGDEPYVFICYAHDDQALVYPEITWLHEQGVNVWYDEGISPGEEWSEELGQAIDGAERFLYFVSPRSVASRHCRNELNFAQNHDKAILSVYLEETELPSGVELVIGASQAIVKRDFTEADYRARLLRSLGWSTESPRVRRAELGPTKAVPRISRVPWGLAALLLLAVGALAAFWLLERSPEERGKATSALDRSIAVTPPVESQSRVRERAIDESARIDVARPRVAVLPFANLSGDPEQEYFSEGISEDILDGLGRNPGLVMRARQSSFQFRGQGLDPVQIANQLDVSYLVSGSVRTMGSRVRVAARLTNVTASADVWSERYELEVTDVFTVQDEITASIVGALGLQFLSSDQARVSPDAYKAYLLGRYHVGRFQLDEAIAAYRRAVEIDPNYGDAYSALAQVFAIRGNLASFSGRDLPESLSKEHRFYVNRALVANPNDPLALGLQTGWLRPQDGLNQLGRLLRKHPNDWNLYYGVANVFRFIGRSDLEILTLDQVVANDPLNVNSLGTRAGSKLFRGDYSGATRDAEVAERLGLPLPMIFAQEALYRRDVEALEAQVRRESSDWSLMPQLRHILAAAIPYLQGDPAGVAQALAPIEAESKHVSNVTRFWIALLNREDALALKHYRRALQVGEFWALYEIQGSHTARALFPEYYLQPGYEDMLKDYDLDADSVASLLIPDLPFLRRGGGLTRRSADRELDHRARRTRIDQWIADRAARDVHAAPAPDTWALCGPIATTASGT